MPNLLDQLAADDQEALYAFLAERLLEFVQEEQAKENPTAAATDVGRIHDLPEDYNDANEARVADGERRTK